MNALKETQVQLPDGSWIKLVGGDAEGTAKLLVNHYLGQGSVAAQNVEEPLTVPGLCYETDSGVPRRQPESVVHNTPQHVANAGEEEPLEIPALRF